MSRDGRRAVVLISIDGLPAVRWTTRALRLPHLRRAGSPRHAGGRPPAGVPQRHLALPRDVRDGPQSGGPRRAGEPRPPIGRPGPWCPTSATARRFRVRGATLWDAAAEGSGFAPAAVCWPKARGAVALADRIPEFYDQPLFEAHPSRPLWEELRDAGLPVDRYGPWSESHALGTAPGLAVPGGGDLAPPPPPTGPAAAPLPGCRRLPARLRPRQPGSAVGAGIRR